MDWTWVADVCSGLAQASQASEGDRAVATGNPGSKVGLILLNAPLSPLRLLQLWQAAEVRICADGAANRLADLSSTPGLEQGEERDAAAPAAELASLIPDAIVGDFDSVRPEVAEMYEARGAVLHNLAHDQDTTDLEKSLAQARKLGCERVVVGGQFAGVAGRLDHTFGIANSLYLTPDLPVVVVGEDCFMLLLAPGEHTLLVPKAVEAPYCGLVPLGSPCRDISTTGLQYDMTNHSMEFGGLVSVCNRVDPSQNGRVWVKTSHHVLWTCTLPPVP